MKENQNTGLESREQDGGQKGHLQLVRGEAGPGSLGRLGLVQLLLRGHSALHVNAVPCEDSHLIRTIFSICINVYVCSFI